MCLQPLFGAEDNLVKFFCFGGAFQLGLTLAFLHPEDGIVRVAVDGLTVESLLPAESQGMHDGEEFPDIIRAFDRTIVEHAIARLKVYRLVFHGSRIAGAGCVHSPCIGTYLHRQWKYGVVAIIGRVLIRHLLTIGLHSLWNFDTQQAHAILDDLGYVLRQHQTEESLLLIWFVQDGVVMIELVEHLCELVAVVGDA